MKKSDIYEQIYNNSKVGRPLFVNYLPSVVKGYVNELYEDGFLDSYNYTDQDLGPQSFVFIKGSYCVITEREDPNSQLFLDRMLGFDQKGSAPFNFMINSEKVYEQWLENTNDDYIDWMERNKSKLHNMLSLNKVSDEMKDDIDTFNEDYVDYIKSKDWYIRNVVIDKAKELVEEELKSFDGTERELRFLSKFNNKISSSDGMGYIQSIFY